MKSAPAIMATWLARATFTRVARSPVPRITFMWASPQACRKARTSSYRASHAPASACARVITTSISCAPAATDALISSMRCGRGFSPAGNPVETAATGISEPCKASTATGTRFPKGDVFPFETPKWQVYAGDCTANSPESMASKGGETLAEVAAERIANERQRALVGHRRGSHAQR